MKTVKFNKAKCCPDVQQEELLSHYMQSHTYPSEIGCRYVALFWNCMCSNKIRNLYIFPACLNLCLNESLKPHLHEIFWSRLCIYTGKNCSKTNLGQNNPGCFDPTMVGGSHSAFNPCLFDSEFQSPCRCIIIHWLCYRCSGKRFNLCRRLN